MERQTSTKANSKAPPNSLQKQSVKTHASHPIANLQRSVGNQAVQRLLQSHFIQAKLQVGAPDDEYEKEADREADRVMRMPEAEETTNLQRAAMNSESSAPAAPAVIHDVLRSPGQPLDPSTRAFMEPRFGHDFSEARVHTDQRAAESAAAVNASAYTVGRHLVFNQGQYSPETESGRHLIAHELTHFTQQSNGTLRPKIQRSRLRDFADPSNAAFEPAVLTDAQIEATNEFKAYMDPKLVWQWKEHMSKVEARLACRLILKDIRAGTAVYWQTDARKYMNKAITLLPRTRDADQRVSPPPGPEAALPDTGLATELGYELEPSSRPPPVAPPPPPPVGGPAPAVPPPPPRVPWDGLADPAAADPAAEKKRAEEARKAMQGELFNAYDEYLKKFRPAVVKLLGNKVPLDAPAAAPGAAGPPPTGVVDIANQAQSVLEARYGTTLDAAAPDAALTAGRAPRTTAAGSENIFDASTEAGRKTMTGVADLAPGVSWWLFDNDVPGVRPKGPAEFASVVLSNHHYSSADDPDDAFRWSVANAYAAANTLAAPNNRQQLIDYRLTQWSESTKGKGFAILSGFDPGADPDRAELEKRWAIFKTSTHESLHQRTHPIFEDAEQGRGTMKEGFPEMFTVATLNTDILPKVRAGGAEALRQTVEGAKSTAAPDATLITDRVSPTQYKDHREAAERIRDGGIPPDGGFHVGVGEAAVRAAFFQGHIEYLGLAPGGAQLGGLRATGAKQQISIPGGIVDLKDLARRSGVSKATIKADNPGITDALPATAVLTGCREHWTIAGESRAQIATQNGVSEADLVRANPDIALDPMTNAWPPLAAGQKLLIPKH